MTTLREKLDSRPADPFVLSKEEVKELHASAYDTDDWPGDEGTVTMTDDEIVHNTNFLGQFLERLDEALRAQDVYGGQIRKVFIRKLLLEVWQDGYNRGSDDAWEDAWCK